ncbi:MAG TPA: ThiF family adenylyltransferase [bacterium]|jgi:hypothetical protein
MNNDLRFLRQQDAVNMSRLTSLGITLIGAGAIGSASAVYLGKMGSCGLTIYDPDSVEDHNWSNQMYRDEDIGKLKCTALSEVMQQFGGHTPNAIAARYDDQPLTEVVISAVDSMVSRNTIFRAVRGQPTVKLYLDARMGLDTLIVYTLHPQVREERSRYWDSLHTDGDSLSEPCTARSVCYTPLMAVAVICNMVKRYVNDEAVPGRVVVDLATYTMMG